MDKVFVFIFGSIVGSFLNVCIYRMPREKSVVKPSSFCPSCKNPIRWYDNVPLISIFLLKLRCRKCAGRISLRYFFVELLTAVLFLAVYKNYGVSFQTPVYWILIGGLIVATYIDIDFQIIPDEVNIGGLILGIVLSFIFPQIHNKTIFWQGGIASVIGALVGGIILQTTRFLGSIVFKKEAMGFGDIKFIAMIGTFLGWRNILLVFFISPIIGSIVGLFILLFKKEHIIPYGPFLAIGSLVAMFWGSLLWDLFFTI